MLCFFKPPPPFFPFGAALESSGWCLSSRRCCSLPDPLATLKYLRSILLRQPDLPTTKRAREVAASIQEATMHAPPAVGRPRPLPVISRCNRHSSLSSRSSRITLSTSSQQQLAVRLKRWMTSARAGSAQPLVPDSRRDGLQSGSHG